MNETAILWTDLSWNPMSGCTPLGPECKHCYARGIAEPKRGTPAFPQGFDLTYRPHKLGELAKVKAPSLVFANSMSDLFHPSIPDEWRDRVLATVAASPRHQVQTLTKRPEVLARYTSTHKLPGNLWVGVSVGHPSSLHRIDTLRGVDAAVRFVSVEPMLADIGPALDLRGMHWLIGGGESGCHLMDPVEREERGMADRTDRGRWVPRPSRIPWARNLRDACAAQGVRFFWKQWGGPKGEAAGRLLDGRTHDEYPDAILALGRATSRHQVSLPLAV